LVIKNFKVKSCFFMMMLLEKIQMYLGVFTIGEKSNKLVNPSKNTEILQVLLRDLDNAFEVKASQTLSQISYSKLAKRTRALHSRLLSHPN